MSEYDGYLYQLPSSSPRVEKECGTGVMYRHGDMAPETQERAERTHPAADPPGFSIATLAQCARDFAPTPRTSRRRRRRHHGYTVEVTRANPLKPLGVQLELGSHGGRHAS